jgi:hypothetical protein
VTPATSSTGLPLLSVGAVMGDSDPESMAWSRAIGALSLRVKDLIVGVHSAVRVSVVYHVDGRMAPNDFEGVRAGRFDRRTNGLVVQASVPKVPVDGRRSLLLGLLIEAVEEAERFFQKKGLTGEFSELRGVLERLHEPGTI